MKPVQSPDAMLTRRHWLLLGGVALSGCGGGGGGLVTALPGTGGTGAVFSQGSITGFGSIILNGVKFDDTQASVQIDGQNALSSHLRLGMVAGVQGVRNGVDAVLGTLLGTASAIEVWSIAQGPVSAATAAGFDVSGMHIQTDNNTSLSGISATTALVDGQTVKVWGLQAGPDGTQWAATRVEVVVASSLRVSSGLVHRLPSQVSLNGWTLAGAAVNGLSDGQVVRVQGISGSAATLDVAAVKVLNAGFATHASGDLEIEGFVTAVMTPQRFMIGPLTVDLPAVVAATLPRALAVGDRLEAYGTWASGVLVASKIEAEGSQSRAIEIDAVIEQFTSVANFLLRSQRCDASQASFSHGQASSLRAGIRVKVEGVLLADVLLVSKLELAGTGN